MTDQRAADTSSPRQGVVVGMVMLGVMAAVVVALNAPDGNAKGPQEQTQASAPPSTMPGYPLDAASRRPVVP